MFTKKFTSWQTWLVWSLAVIMSSTAVARPKRAPAPSPSPTPTVTSTPTPIVTSTPTPSTSSSLPAQSNNGVTVQSSFLSKSSLNVGESVTSTINISASSLMSNMIICIRFHDAATNNKLAERCISPATLSSAVASFSNSFAPTYAGNYNIQVGVFDQNWFTYIYVTRETFSVGSSTVVTPPPTTLSQSADGTTVPSASQIVDSVGAVWTLSSSATVLRNGVAAGYSANVILLVYKNSKVYQENSAGGFWYWDGSTWQASSDPRGVVSSPSPTPTPTATSVPSSGTGGDPGLIPVYATDNFFQIGTGSSTAFVNRGIWGAAGLTEGTYTGINGSTYEHAVGVSKNLGPNGEIAWRTVSKWPTGTTEVKAYPSAIHGAKPGCQNSWITPCGNNVILPDGSTSQVYPSGPTPQTFMPLQLPLPPIYSSFNYKHNATPTGRGHLSYDIWLQNSPTQQHGWNAAGEITHEIMIPITYWGNYGAHNGGRNPGWYSHDATIDGLLFHIYFVPAFTSGWQWNFVVFEPDSPTALSARTLDLSKFLNYLKTRNWATGNEYLVSTELGIENVDGTVDMNVFNYRVWKP